MPVVVGSGVELRHTRVRGLIFAWIGKLLLTFDILEGKDGQPVVLSPIACNGEVQSNASP